MKKISKVALIAVTLAVTSAAGISKVNAYSSNISGEVKKGSFITLFLDEAYTNALEEATYSSTGFTTKEEASGELTITGYSGSDTNIEIPKTIDDKTVRMIGNKAFQNNKTIKKVKITADITSIGDFAFAGCEALEEVELPESILTIGQFCFLGTSLNEIDLHSKIKIIKTDAFQETNISEIVLPESLEQLHSSAFRLCRNLKTVKVYSKNLVYDYDYGQADDASRIFEYCPEDLVLYGYKGSTTETYASENHLHFSELGADVEVTGVTLNKSTLSLTKDKKETLIATVAPENATNKTVTWTSSDETVATVSSTGEVTGVKKGNATITATTHNGKKAVCSVIVNDSLPKQIFYELAVTTGSAFHLITGEEKDVKLGVYDIPETEIKNITCGSTDTTVATVGTINPETSSVKVKALKAGKTTLTAELNYEGEKYNAEYQIEIKDKYADYYDFKISGDTSVKIGQTLQLKVEEKMIDGALPTYDRSEEATWKSSDESILKVDGKGLVTGVKEGKATVTASYKNLEAELTAEHEVTVSSSAGEVTKIEVQKEPSKKEYYIGDKISIDDGELLVTYEDGTTRTISMGNEDVKVENFDTSAAGEIEVKLTYGGQSTTLKFTVKKKDGSEEEGDGEDKGKEEEPEEEEEEEVEEKIDTGDSIIETVIALVVSAALIIFATIKIKGKKKKDDEENAE